MSAAIVDDTTKEHEVLILVLMADGLWGCTIQLWGNPQQRS